jgi:hypothetical protein
MIKDVCTEIRTQGDIHRVWSEWTKWKLKTRICKFYTQNLKTHDKDRLNKDVNVRMSYDTRKWTKIEKGIKRGKKINMILDAEGRGLQNAVMLAVRPSRIQRQRRRCPRLPLIWLFMERKERCPRERFIGLSLFHSKPHIDNGTRTLFNWGRSLNLQYQQCVTLWRHS